MSNNTFNQNSKIHEKDQLKLKIDFTHRLTSTTLEKDVENIIKMHNDTKDNERLNQLVDSELLKQNENFKQRLLLKKKNSIKEFRLLDDLKTNTIGGTANDSQVKKKISGILNLDKIRCEDNRLSLNIDTDLDKSFQEHNSSENPILNQNDQINNNSSLQLNNEDHPKEDSSDKVIKLIF